MTSVAAADRAERSSLLARQRVRGWRRSTVRRLRRLGVVGAGLALATGLVAAGTRWLLVAPSFAVAAVVVEGAERTSPEAVLAAAAIAPGTNLWRIDTAAAARRVAGLRGIRDAEVVRALPNRVVVRVVERRPFALVGGERLSWLDEDGYALGPARGAPAPGPLIAGVDDTGTGSEGAPGPLARTAVGLVRHLLRRGGALADRIVEVEVGRSVGPVLWTVDDIEVRVGHDDWAGRLDRLEAALETLARTGADPQLGGLAGRQLGDLAGRQLGKVAGPQPVRLIDLRYADQAILRRGAQR